MIICDNGVYREATPEEQAVWENTPPPEELVLIEKAEAFDIIFGSAE